MAPQDLEGGSQRTRMGAAPDLRSYHAAHSPAPATSAEQSLRGLPQTLSLPGKKFAKQSAPVQWSCGPARLADALGGPSSEGPAEVSTHRSPLSLFPKSQFFYCKVSRSNLFFSQLEVNDAHKPNFFPLGALWGSCDASGEYPAISLKRMTQMTCCLFEHPL